MSSAAIYGLLYGDYPALHRRLINSLLCQRGLTDVRVTFWCNQVCEATLRLLRTTPFHLHVSGENVPKYRAMRNLLAAGVPERWVVWFDDDAHLLQDDWLEQMDCFVRAREAENVCYVGELYTVPLLPGEWEFVCRSPWFRGRPPLQIDGREGILFAQGSCWWLRTDVLRLLDWPDPRLNHNGGDTLLGEAVRQAGLPFHHCNYGVKTNDAPRRGYHESPAGCTDPDLRR